MNNIIALKTERVKRANWINYCERRPQIEGLYLWRVPHVHNGHVLQFKAKMRKRGAGYETVLSFQGDHWTGYEVTVPDGLQWREIVEGDPDLVVEDLSAACCPFCGEAPAIKTYDGFVSSLPFQERKLSIKCCYAAVEHFDYWDKAFEAWNTRKKE